MHSDRAYNVVVSGRTLYFGNNVDNHVYALDTRTAEERWRFAAGGAVRFAPVANAMWKLATLAFSPLSRS